MITKCQDCNEIFEYSGTENSLKLRKFCINCRKLRKNKCMESYKSDKPIGRPRKEFIKLPESKMIWDQVNFGGY